MASTTQQGVGVVGARGDRYGLIECGNQAVSISLWETEAEANAANAVAQAWVRDNIAQNVRLETTYVGDLAFFSPAPVLV